MNIKAEMLFLPITKATAVFSKLGGKNSIY